jgi:membrane associated rhomboid family serine protease
MSYPAINFNRTPVTLILMAISVALELICTFDEARRNFYYNDAQLGIWIQIWRGQLWRPFTTTVLHGGLLHMAMNISVLFRFGPVLEYLLGSYRMLGLIVLLAYTSSLSQYVLGNYFIADVQDQSSLVGLSGVLFGIFGFMFVGRSYNHDLRTSLSPEMIRFVGIWFAFCVIATQLNILRIGNIAHGSGFVFGGLYGLAYFPTPHRKLWIALAIVATCLILATLIACPGHAGYEYAISF